MAESEELKSLLMKLKEESDKVGLKLNILKDKKRKKKEKKRETTTTKLNIQKTKIMASGPITSWQIDGERLETVRDDRRWDDWMAPPTQWTWVWVNSRSLWWTGRPVMLQSMGLWRVGHDWATEQQPVLWDLKVKENRQLLCLLTWLCCTTCKILLIVP